MFERMRRPALLTTLALALFARAAASGAAAEPCEVAAVGGGWSGVYFAYRYHLTGSIDPRKLCLFEASERIGGRTYSKHVDVPFKGAVESYVIDVGAYRFSPDMHLPGDVILKHLKIPTACYEPDCEPAYKDFPPPFKFNYTAPLMRIIDPATKRPGGYVTALNMMVAEMEGKGARVMRGKKLTDIFASSSGGADLVFEDGSRVSAATVLLNLPRTPLLALPGIRSGVTERTLKMLQCVKFDTPHDLFPGMKMGHSLTKAYAYYDDAWWINALNETEGQLPKNAFNPILTKEGIPIGLHFNDGPTICDAPGVGCRGWLEVYYATRDQEFFDGVKTSDEEPSGVMDASSPGGAAKLAKLHAAVMEATEPLFRNKSLAPPATAPRMLVVGVWSREGKAYTAPTKVYYSAEMGDSMAKACNVSGLTRAEYRDTVNAPFGSQSRVHVANNDWIAEEIADFHGDWAEESLLQAERALRALGVARPDWLDAAYYEEKIASVVALGAGQGLLQILV